MMDIVEPILEELKKWKGTAAVALFNIEVLKEEIERLRKALLSAKECVNDKAYTAAIMVIDTALQQKETE